VATAVIVAVYTIALDEAAHIERWADSAADADIRVVVDTGSSDDTRQAATEAGCDVHRIHVAPWRFDDARNASLALVPGWVDMCVALDCDEELQPGWRDALEALAPEVTRPRYRYTWSWNPDGTPGLQYMGDKIHARRGYRWKHPIHEVVAPVAGEIQTTCGLEIHHHPDPGKARSYLPLLELSVVEDPTDDRNAHYYARELYYHGRLDQAAIEFKRHLALPAALWAPERAKSMRLLARCEPWQEHAWLLRACAEDPGQREVWLDLAAMYYRQSRWEESYAAAVRCLSITDRSLSYLSEAEAWGAAPYDYAAIAAYRTGRWALALEHGKAAACLDPGDPRLAANLADYETAMADSPS
jgi:glycosyltransferase involved in cell wall biosynthesis